MRRRNPGALSATARRADLGAGGRWLVRAVAASDDVRLGTDPAAFAPLGSLEFSKLLLREAGVAVAPGIGFGEHGDTHVRFALVENAQRIRQAGRSIRSFMARHHNVVDRPAEAVPAQ